MKLIYCIASIYNPGGMERVLLNKVRWLIKHGDYDISIITTDQQGRPLFYSFPEEVKLVDLDINYSVDNSRSPFAKITSYFHKRKKHRKALSEYLMREKADIVISLYPSESSFIPKIKDGSKKVLELHYCKYFRIQYGRKGLLGIADRFRAWQDERIVRRFDKFVVLTREDAGFWGELHNLEVIPNAALTGPKVPYDTSCRRVIAVGRLDYQKSFDRLLSAWALLPKDLLGQWKLDIFGQGEWKDKLLLQISNLKIGASARINPPTSKIFEEYSSSAFITMSSHYEGLPMVLIEAMSLGIPGVCFGFKCGPKDIIRDGENGLIVQEGDIPALSKAMERMMRDDNLRLKMSDEASKITSDYSEERVMGLWTNCFQSLLS